MLMMDTALSTHCNSCAALGGHKSHILLVDTITVGYATGLYCLHSLWLLSQELQVSATICPAIWPGVVQEGLWQSVKVTANNAREGG